MTEGITLNDRYKLLKRVGAGGMASVYRAQDLMLGRVVAVKMLHEGLESDELFARQFQREAHAAANLSHPNIVTVHDIGRHNHRSYIVMEYVDGKTLKQLIRDYAREGQLMPLRRVLDIIIQVCQGIGYAHRTGLVHCDVKPQNVIITADDRVKVADFGIARAMSQASMHHSDMVWGTPQYFSPEQAAGEAPTPASDVYSIGVIFFEMLSNRLPFEGESSTAIALKHIQEPPPAVSQFNPQAPNQLVKIINKILSKEPAGRYRTAGQLGRILSAYRDRSSELTILTPTTPSPSKDIPLPEGPPMRVEISSPQPADNFMNPDPFYDPIPEPEHETTTFSTTELLFLNKTDWVGITLGITALIALIGLIPLWYLVYLAYQ